MTLVEKENESSQHCCLEESCFPQIHGIGVIPLSRTNPLLAFSPGSSSWTTKQTPWCTLSNMPGSCALSTRARASPCPWRSSSSSATASEATPAGPLHTLLWSLGAGRASGTTTSRGKGRGLGLQGVGAQKELGRTGWAVLDDPFFAVGAG